MDKKLTYNGLEYEISSVQDEQDRNKYAFLVGAEDYSVKHLDIPASIIIDGKMLKVVMDEDDETLSQFSELESISISGEDSAFIVENGNLYSENKQILYWVSPFLDFYKIPDSVVGIFNDAFIRALSLKVLAFSGSMKEIWNIGLENCINLETVVLPEDLETIGYATFENCKNLKKINFPKKLKHIGDEAFYSCEQLSQINISFLTTLGSRAFKKSGIYEIKLPDNLKTISSSSLSECHHLSKIRLPYYLEKIEDSAFSNCTSLSKIDLPARVKKIGKRAFWNCWCLEEFKIPAALETIGEGAFAYCRDLTSFDVDPDNNYFSSEKNGLFNKAKTHLFRVADIPHIVLPSSLESIDKYAFTNCKYIKSLTLNAVVPPINPDGYNYISGFKEYLSEIKIYVPAQSLEEYKAHPIWGKAEILLPIK